jgi:hypothetical protein
VWTRLKFLKLVTLVVLTTLLTRVTLPIWKSLFESDQSPPPWGGDDEISTSASARTDDRRNHASPGLVTSRSTESTAPVHGRIGSLRRAARVSLFCFAGGSADRAGAGAIQSAIAARLTEPCCDCVVGQPGMPAYVADLHRGVYLFGSRRLNLELRRYEIAT